MHLLSMNPQGKRYFRKDHEAKIKIIDKFGCHNDIQNVKYFA